MVLRISLRFGNYIMVAFVNKLGLEIFDVSSSNFCINFVTHVLRNGIFMCKYSEAYLKCNTTSYFNIL